MKTEQERTRRDPLNNMYAYVTRDDLLDVFGEDAVTLTMRNFTEIRQKTRKTEENEITEHILNVTGKFKKVDVRLVTTDGEALEHKPQISDDTTAEDDGSDKQCSTSQSSISNASDTGVRRPNRRRKPEKLETKDDENGIELDGMPATQSTNDEEIDSEFDERRLVAEALLGYRPPSKLKKRNFDADCEAFERKNYFSFSFCCVKKNVFFSYVQLIAFLLLNYSGNINGDSKGTYTRPATHSTQSAAFRVSIFVTSN